MIDVSGGGIVGRHSSNTSPMSMAHSRDHHRAGSFRRSPWTCLHNIPSQGVLMKSNRAELLRPDALPDVNNMREMQYHSGLNLTNTVVQMCVHNSYTKHQRTLETIL